jgi:hypothetical protein
LEQDWRHAATYKIRFSGRSRTEVAVGVPSFVVFIPARAFLRRLETNDMT